MDLQLKALCIPDLPKPILFHPLKHHLQYIKNFIRQSATISEADIKAIFLTIGSSQLDLYLGKLSPWQIAKEAILYLQNQKLLQAEAYHQYLAAGGADYQIVTLSDATNWVLRWGVVKERHVHLHPARYAANTIRVKANSLKTAVATLVAVEKYNKPEISLQLVNRVRGEWLALSPLKSLCMHESIGRLIMLLQTPIL